MKKALLVGLGTMLFFTACKKNDVELSMDGKWIEISDVQSETPTGCTLEISKSDGTVKICGVKQVHPENIKTLTTRPQAKLFVENGQMFYRQKDMGLLWVASIHYKDLYFMDYVLDGKYLWVVGDDTDKTTAAVGSGRVFIRP